MKLYNKLILLASGLLMLTSCDSDDWNAGEEVADNMSVYFPNQGKYSYELEDNDSRNITVTVKRAKASEAADVPLKVLESPEGVVVPGTVHFDAGSTESAFNVDCSGLQQRDPGKLVVAIDPAYANIYSAGTTSLQLNLSLAAPWLLLSDDIDIVYYISDLYPQTPTSLYVQEGTDHFKLTNFMNSGLDLKFTLKEPSEETMVVPYENALMYSEVYPEDDDEYEMWYFYDSVNDEYPSWSITGGEPDIDYVEFYGTYSYFNLYEGYAFFSNYINFLDGSYVGGSFYLYFDIAFDPFQK